MSQVDAFEIKASPESPNQTPYTQLAPGTALEKRMRRAYKVEYKIRTISFADACVLVVLIR